MYRKHELVVALKHKGWKGDESRLTKQQVEEMLRARNIAEPELGKIIRAFKTGSLSVSGESAQAARSLTQQEVVALIAAAFTRGGEAADESSIKRMIDEAVAKAQPHKIVIDTAAEVKKQV